MKVSKTIHTNYLKCESRLDKFISNFDSSGKIFGKADRNTIKLFHLDNQIINVKSFRIPNLINQVVYNFFRKSKAQRSYEYANKLDALNIGTPQPIAYYEFKGWFLFKRSFYICQHLDCDLTYRELTFNFDYPDFEKILREFTRFTYNLHENGINFLDHSPGNTLIKKEDEHYKFYLVDLNRMEFASLDFETRIKNFARLTIHKNMIEIMSDEYAKCSGEDYDKICNLMWKTTEDFQERFHRKKRLKNKLFFWRAKK
ncbi:Lipopolysaccharide kinase (Kdo/WaaP) family protein [Flavobacteriaceae bacterium MAR_2010_188]|nr:Lipopolysaccharide kinase (Kdo/WaaP) family protein [Flavobacteriaceae bacterium MAR_2010_188]